MSLSNKHKRNSRSSTEAETVAVDDASSKILWSIQFLKHQGIKTRECRVHQDDKSAIQLEVNGRQSAGSRSRHMDITMFHIKDQVDQGKVVIKCCPTDQMIADFLTKPKQGSQFQLLRKLMGVVKQAKIHTKLHVTLCTNCIVKLHANMKIRKRKSETREEHHSFDTRARH